MPGIEGRVLRHDGIEPLGRARSRVRQGPSSDRSAAATSAVGASGAWSITLPGIGTTLLSWAPGATLRRRAVIGRPLAAGALPEHAAQAQEDEDRQRQEDDGVDIHVAIRFLLLTPATGPAVERSLVDGNGRTLHHRFKSAACRHETMPGQWRVLARVNCSAFWRLRGNPILPGNRAYSIIYGRNSGRPRAAALLSHNVRERCALGRLAMRSSLWRGAGLC